MSGFSDLGYVLAGGGPNADMTGIKGYQAGLEAANSRARIDNALLEARKSRDAEVGRQALAKAAFDKGDDELGNFFLQGTNPASIGNYRLDRQKQGFLGDAMDLAKGANADPNLLNRELMVISGKPSTLTRVEGHDVFNPMVTPDAQTINTDQLGQAMIGSEHALAGQREAAAGASRALAAKREGAPQLTDADLGDLMRQATEMANRDGPGSHTAEADAWLQQQVAERGGTGGGNVKPTALTKTEITSLFGDGNGSVDGAAYRRFLSYQHAQSQHDPRFRDARYAAQAFAASDMSGATGGSATTAPPPASPVEEGLGSRIMDAITSLGGSAAPAPVDPAQQMTGTDAVGPLSPEDAAKLPPGTLFKTTDGRILRRH